MLLLLAVGLTGCSPAGPDANEVQEWLTAASDDPHNERNVLGTAAGVASTRDVGHEDGVVLGDLNGATVESIEFACFGEEKMTLEWSAAGDSNGRGAEQILTCADGPRTVEVGIQNVNGVRVNGTSAQGAGAWSAVIRGEG